MKKHTYNTTTIIIGVIAAIFLVLTFISGWPYGFFKLLRWATTLTALYFMYISYNAGIKWITFISLLAAILFNPIAPIYMDRGTWLIFDGIAAGLILLFTFKLRSID